MEGEDRVEQRFDRQMLLKLAAATGGAGLVAGRAVADTVERDGDAVVLGHG
jgi:hypothetical protein